MGGVLSMLFAGADRRCFVSAGQSEGVLGDFAYGSAAGEGQGEFEVGLEVLDDFAYAGFAGDGERVDPGAAEADGGSAEREGLEEVGAAADAAVEDDGDFAVDG